MSLEFNGLFPFVISYYILFTFDFLILTSSGKEPDISIKASCQELQTAFPRSKRKSVNWWFSFKRNNFPPISLRSFSPDCHLKTFSIFQQNYYFLIKTTWSQHLSEFRVCPCDLPNWTIMTNSLKVRQISSLTLAKQRSR